MFTDSPTNQIQPVPASQQSLRKRLRARRRALSPIQQRTAARKLCRRIIRQTVLRQSRHIALYRAAPGEIDPAALMPHLWRQHKHCYLPVLHPVRAGRMLFVRVSSRSRFVPNRWGIPEPHWRLTDVLPAQQLDLVLVPLVGFDRQGNRLGMGKGYYDRQFAFRLQARQVTPILLGLAHDCQEVTEGIMPSAWDVPMDAMVTPDRYYPIRAVRHSHG